MKKGTSNGSTRSKARAARSTVTRAIGLVPAGGAASATLWAMDRQGRHATARAVSEARTTAAQHGPAEGDAGKWSIRCRALRKVMSRTATSLCRFGSPRKSRHEPQSAPFDVTPSQVFVRHSSLDKVLTDAL